MDLRQQAERVQNACEIDNWFSKYSLAEILQLLKMPRIRNLLAHHHRKRCTIEALVRRAASDADRLQILAITLMTLPEYRMDPVPYLYVFTTNPHRVQFVALVCETKRLMLSERAFHACLRAFDGSWQRQVFTLIMRYWEQSQFWVLRSIYIDQFWELLEREELERLEKSTRWTVDPEDQEVYGIYSDADEWCRQCSADPEFTVSLVRSHAEYMLEHAENPDQLFFRLLDGAHTVLRIKIAEIILPILHKLDYGKLFNYFLSFSEEWHLAEILFDSDHRFNEASMSSLLKAVHHWQSKFKLLEFLYDKSNGLFRWTMDDVKAIFGDGDSINPWSWLEHERALKKKKDNKGNEHEDEKQKQEQAQKEKLQELESVKRKWEEKEKEQNKEYDLIEGTEVRVSKKKKDPEKHAEPCAVCMEDEYSRVILIPCGDSNICRMCAVKLAKKQENVCPMCRSKYTHINAIF